MIINFIGCKDPIRRAAYETAIDVSETMTKIAQKYKTHSKMCLTYIGILVERSASLLPQNKFFIFKIEKQIGIYHRMSA